MDPAQIDQILANLAINARDAIAGQGKLAIETANIELQESSASISADFTPGEYVLLSVSDNGSGMTQEVLEHLFEPFFRTKEAGKGTGLGLAMVFGIVKQNRGPIHVASAPGSGTTFKIYLPRTSAIPQRGQIEPLSAQTPRGDKTVLLVEDEPQVLELGSKFLQRCGYTVLSASTPEAALGLAARHPGRIHLLVTDMIMPGMNGWKLKEKLEEAFPEVKSLFVSGYAAEIPADQPPNAPPMQFLHTPFSIESLARKVRELLDAR